MALEIFGVDSAGDIDNEMLILRVKGDSILTWSYAVLDNTYKDGELSNKLRHIFYFDDASPYEHLKEGDRIYLYSGEGTNKVKTQGDKKICYYYWGLSKSIWNKGGDTATLLEIEKRTDKSV